MRTLLLAVLTLSAWAATTPCPPAAHPHHYVFFGADRERIHDVRFLKNRGIEGAEIKYAWRQLEPERGAYELAPMLEDLEFLERHGKRLVVQLQDVTFTDVPAVPQWLCADSAYGGGMARKWESPRDDDRYAHFEAGSLGAGTPPCESASRICSIHWAERSMAASKRSCCPRPAPTSVRADGTTRRASRLRATPRESARTSRPRAVRSPRAWSFSTRTSCPGSGCRGKTTDT